ncbi:MAG: hypothetical protein SCJ93_14045 [Bacillota bacterium]|nr:hypothetical protein [Bacillota bacterium]
MKTRILRKLLQKKWWLWITVAIVLIITSSGDKDKLVRDEKSSMAIRRELDQSKAVDEMALQRLEEEARQIQDIINQRLDQAK